MAAPVVTHRKISGKPLGPDPTRVYGADWDDDHVITGFDEAVAGALPDNFATQAEAEGGSNDSKLMSPLLTKQQIDARLAGEATAEAGTDNSDLMTALRVNQNVTQRESAVGVVDLTQPPYSLALDTPTVDQASIINQACLDYEGKGATLVIPANATPTVGIASTIMIPRGVTLQGGNGYGGNNQAAVGFTGAILSWVGANDGTMVHLFGVNHSAFRGIKLDGNGASGMTGLHLSSVNDPSSSYNIAKHFTIKNCFKSIILGDPGDTAYAPVGTDPNNVGRAQNDNILIEDFTIFGDATDGSTGIHINGTNTCQTSLICRGNIQSVDYGVRAIQNNGTLEIKHLVGGTPAGTHKAFFRFESTLAVAPTLYMNEVEGSWTYSLHDSIVPYDDGAGTTFAHFTYAMRDNSFNCPVLIDGSSFVLSECNSGGSPSEPAAAWTVGGSARVISIMDTNPIPDLYASSWQTTGSGTVSSWSVSDNAVSLFTDRLAAGKPVAVGTMPPGSISSRTSGDTTGRYYFGSDATVYLDRQATLVRLTGAALGTGVAPTYTPGSGEIFTNTASGTGLIWFGSDGNAVFKRDGNDFKIVMPLGGVAYVNGAAVNPEGSPIGATTPSTGKFTTLESTSQLKVPVGSTGTPAIYSATPDVGMIFSATTGVSFTKGGGIFCTFSPTGFTTQRNGNANVSILGRTDAHGSGATLAQLAFQGVDSASNTTNYARIDAVAVTNTDGAEEGRYDFRASISGTLQIIAQVTSAGFNISTGTLRVANTDVIGSNRHLKLRSYTVATLPSASTAGEMIYVSDGTSNKRLGVSDGTNWRFPDGAIVS